MADKHGYLACQLEAGSDSVLRQLLVDKDSGMRHLSDTSLVRSIFFLLELLLYGDDLEAMGRDRSGRMGIPLAIFLAALGFSFKWSAIQGKMGEMKIPVMIRVLCLWLAERLEGCDRLQAPSKLTTELVGPRFFIDAKAADGRAWIGGFLEIVEGCQGPWFSLEVRNFNSIPTAVLMFPLVKANLHLKCA